MQEFKFSSEIKLNNSRPHFISMNYEGSQFIILQHTNLSYYKKIGNSYELKKETSNFISKWDIYDIILHHHDGLLGVIHKYNFKLHYTIYRFTENKNRWVIYFSCKLLNVDNSLNFPIELHLNPSLNLINTTCNQPILEDQIGLFQIQVRQHAKCLRQYKIQGEKLKYFDQKKLILSVCHKKIFIYKYYHFQPLHVYNAKCNVFDITFNQEGLIFIFCSSGLIIWDLNVLKRQQIIELDPLPKNLSAQLELYYIKGMLIFSTNDKTFYQFDLNEKEKLIKSSKEYSKFISNAKGNIFFLFEYHQSNGKLNKLRVFEQM